MAPRDGALPQADLNAKFADYSNGASFVSASPDMSIQKMQGVLPSPLFKNMADASVSASADTKTYVSPAVSTNFKPG
jgi:hypothetical protein